MRTNQSNKKDTVAWLGIALGILSGFLSFWAGNAVMGDRVARLQADSSESQRMQTTLHARIEKVDRDNDKAIEALRIHTETNLAKIVELQHSVKDLQSRAKGP